MWTTKKLLRLSYSFCLESRFDIIIYWWSSSFTPDHSLRKPKRILHDLELHGSCQVYFKILFIILIILVNKDFSRWNRILFRIGSSSCSDDFWAHKTRSQQNSFSILVRILARKNIEIFSRVFLHSTKIELESCFQDPLTVYCRIR